MEVVIICVHIMYPFGNNMLKCILGNIFKAFEYMIMCESTHGINILAIQIPLTIFDCNYHIPDETILCLT